MCSIKDYVEGQGNAEARYYREVFSYDASFYQNFISSHAQQILDESKKLIDQNTLNGNPHALNLSNCIQKASYAREQLYNDRVVANENKSRTLKRNEERRAGFINASILFYAILNIGIIIAVTLIIL